MTIIATPVNINFIERNNVPIFVNKISATHNSFIVFYFCRQPVCCTIVKLSGRSSISLVIALKNTFTKLVITQSRFVIATKKIKIFVKCSSGYVRKTSVTTLISPQFLRRFISKLLLIFCCSLSIYPIPKSIRWLTGSSSSTLRIN